MKTLPPLRLTGASVLRGGEFVDSAVGIADGRIGDGTWPEVDLTGYLILPGIVDLHGDGFERQIAPRPTAPFPIPLGLQGTDREAAACGITTAWLAQSWSWEGGHRSPDYAEALMTALARYRDIGLTDLRVQIRCETHMVESADRLIAAVGKHGVGYVIFNNHLDETLALARTAPDVIAGWAKKAHVSVETFLARVEAARDEGPRVPRFLCSLAAAFDEIGVLYGSHDDPDGETRERYSLIGARICEFPLSRAAARAAKAVGDPVLMGAPNVVRGGSQSGNVAALSLIESGECDILVSDYHYPALPAAAFHLTDLGMMPLAKAWAMISERPAALMRLSDRGRLEEGMSADLTVIDAETRQVEMTLVRGRVSHLSGRAATRLMAAAPTAALAAAE
ncbi:MAG: alpha-D-ribose 1-methylphosphonate 5-triphosphate diphosphatase [Pseudomonadota bacterium]